MASSSNPKDTSMSFTAVPTEESSLLPATAGDAGARGSLYTSGLAASGSANNHGNTLDKEEDMVNEEHRFWWMGQRRQNDNNENEEEEEEDDVNWGLDESPPSGRAGAMFNLLNCILDAGIVGVPYVLGQSGLSLGITLVVLTGIATCYGLELLISIGDRAARNGAISCVAYEEVAELAGGFAFRGLLLLVQFLFCFGALVGYVIVVKDNLADAIHGLGDHSESWTGNDEWLSTVAVSVLLLLPLCCLRSVADIGHVSAITIAVVIGIICLFAYYLGENGFEGTSGRTAAPKSESVDTLGICIFAFLCHHNQFSIYRSLGARATPDTWVPIVRGAVAFALLTSLVIGIIVFQTFGNDIKSDIFKNYVSASHAIDVARLLMSLNMLLSFPMNFGVARETLQVLIAQLTSDSEEKDRHNQQRGSIAGDRRSHVSFAYEGKRLSVMTGLSKVSQYSCLSFDAEGRPTTAVWSELDKPPLNMAFSAAGGGVRERTSNLLHIGTTAPLFLVTIIAGLVAPDLGPTLDLVGGLLGSLLGFVFPAYFALQLEETPKGGRVACWVMLVVGLAVGITATVTSLRQIALGESDD